MARVKEIHFPRRSWQEHTYRHVRRELLGRWRRSGFTGGIVLADGVGLGKTYEALAAAATLLTQRQHFKERKALAGFRLIAIVPPGLVTKWADELLLPERFPKYLTGWTSVASRAVARTFQDVAVLRKKADLLSQRGKLRYGRHELPAGFYVVNVNLVTKEGRKHTQLRKTRWDAVIIDEAHRVCPDVLEHARTILSGAKTATILLTATPFQLSPQEMKSLFAATYSGTKNPEAQGERLWDDQDFRAFRTNLRSFFQSGEETYATRAIQRRSLVRRLLLPRLVRNRSPEKRCYHFVDRRGLAVPIEGDFFRLDDSELARFLRERPLIELDGETTTVYVEARNALAEACADSNGLSRPFVAGTLRQLLSSYGQFRRSRFGPSVHRTLPPDAQHPKLGAATNLVCKLVRDEARRALRQGWIGKVLLFTTYVGAERGVEMPDAEDAHGTASLLKRAFERQLLALPLLRRATRRERARIAETLSRVVTKHGEAVLEQEDRRRLLQAIRRFAGTPAARLILASSKNLKKEARELAKMLQAVGRPSDDGSLDEEGNLRLDERRRRLLEGIQGRYATRNLVARYDGATQEEDRERHLRGFNSPFAPLVLVASSVAQEGIDLQRYCRHVVHYDLEWNPAKVEQREGRVDRQGRQESSSPVNVYFLVCKGTYDERVLHVMTNRFRWHHVLLARKNALSGDPGLFREVIGRARLVERLKLDLGPER